MFFNSLINNINFDSFKISLFYFRYAIFVIAIAALMDFDHKFIKYFFYCISFCFFILILDGFYQYFVGKNIFGFENNESMRISSFFGDEKKLGSFVSRLLPLVISMLIFSNISYLNKYKVKELLIIASTIMIIMSTERIALLYLALFNERPNFFPLSLNLIPPIKPLLFISTF